MVKDVKTRLRRYLSIFILLIVIFYSFKITKINLIELIVGINNSFQLLKEMIPPDFTDFKHYLVLLLETLGIGVVGSAVGLMISFLLSFLAARNTAPNFLLYAGIKGVVNVLRAIPEFIYALVLVGALGIGSLPGIIAIILHTVGLGTKFYSEAIESVDIGPVEALRSTGASIAHVIRYAILPQVVPLFVGYTMYLIDHNVRVVVGLGIIGAGGIGLELYRRIRQFQYDKVATILIMVIVLISIISKISDYLRNAFMEGTFLSKKRRFLDVGIVVFFSIVAIGSTIHMVLSTEEVLSALPRISEMLKYMWPPDLTDLNEYGKLMLETMGMAITGTVFASIIAFFLAVLSAQNITKVSFIRSFGIEITNFLRAMPDIIFALFFVVAIGLGPFPGVLALALSSAGLLAKFYTEVIENIDAKQIEAIDGAGANTLQRIRFAILPQILPLFNSYNLYILDRNVRTSTVLGIVGAGGIGYLLTVYTKLMEYSKTTSLIIIIFLTVLIVDLLSTRLRRRILE